MKDLGNKLGELTNKPSDSKLHRHALSSKDNVKNHDENGKTDEEVFFVSSVVSLHISFKCKTKRADSYPEIARKGKPQ